MIIKSNNIDILYKKILKEILDKGKPITARGLLFRELQFQHLILTNPRSRIIQNPTRKLAKRFMAAEFIWIMSGQCSLDMIGYYNKNMKLFSDNGIDLHGAYGPRLRHWGIPRGDVDQLESCLQRLRDDIYTRQAVIVIIDPAIDFTVRTKDIPCNDILQFMYRDNKLNLACYVRSNDAMLGFPYDIHHWTMLQELFASILNVELGIYHHIVGSLHLYLNDLNKAKKIANTNDFTHESMPAMLKHYDLSIFDELKVTEKQYREDDILSLNGLNSYWQSYIQNIVKRV